MSTGTSIVGTWTAVTDWSANGSVTPAGTFTFNADGTWTSTAPSYSGRWIQVEGMAIWNFTAVQGLVYSGNVTVDAVVGIMGYPLPPPNPGPGCFYLIREEQPGAKLKAKPGFDPLVGHPHRSHG